MLDDRIVVTKKPARIAVTVRLPLDLDRNLEEISRATRRSKTEILELALQEFFARAEVAKAE